MLEFNDRTFKLSQIDANDVKSGVPEFHGERKSDIAESNDANFGRSILNLFF